VLLAFTIVTLMWPFLFTTGAPTDDPAGGGARALRRLRDRVHLVGAAVRGIRSLAARAVLLFSISSFRNGTLVVTTYFTAIPAMFLLTTLFLQIGIGTEPVFAGMVDRLRRGQRHHRVVRRLARRAARPPARGGGLIVVLVSVVALAVVAYTVPAGVVEYAMAGVMVLAGAGAGFVVAPNQTLTLAEIPTREGASPVRSASSASASARRWAPRSGFRCSTRRSTARRTARATRSRSSTTRTRTAWWPSASSWASRC
jgi:hypothetical protein